MARTATKTFEEQLEVAYEELKKAEEKVINTKQKIADLNHAIRERDKENVFAMLEEQGLSVDDFKEFIASKKQEEDKVIEIKSKKRA